LTAIVTTTPSVPAQIPSAHKPYAIELFSFINRVADNYAELPAVLQHIRQLEEERNSLEDLLTDPNRTDEEKLHWKQQAEEASAKLEGLQQAVADLQAKEVNYTETIKHMHYEVHSKRHAPTDEDANNIPDPFESILATHFIPPQTDASYEDKFEANVNAQHHRENNTLDLLNQLRHMPFVKKIGVDYKHPGKSKKVRTDQNTSLIHLHIPCNNLVDIVRITTTAQSRAQQLVAAHYIANEFNTTVQEI
jgi:hypothetical protein